MAGSTKGGDGGALAVLGGCPVCEDGPGGLR